MATRKRGRISKAFKREVAIEYIQGGVTLQALALKYNLRNAAQVSSWVHYYLTPEELANKCVSSPKEKESETQETSEEMTKQTPTPQDPMVAALEQRIQDLEKLLKHSQLKCKALETMIDIAEEQGMPVRKKSGAKQ